MVFIHIAVSTPLWYIIEYGHVKPLLGFSRGWIWCFICKPQADSFFPPMIFMSYELLRIVVFNRERSLPPRRYLAMFGNIRSCHNRHLAGGDKGACKTILQHTGQPPQHRISQPKLSEAPKLRNPVVESCYYSPGKVLVLHITFIFEIRKLK